MLTHVELLSLSHLLQDEHVLSVYIDGSVRDPAQRHTWRVELDHALEATRRSLDGATHAERAAFEDCVALLENRLARLGGTGAVGAPGWVAFITRTVVHLAEPVSAPVPTLALWAVGICLTPYVRALKQTRPVAVVVADARKARIYRYVSGSLTRAETIHARAVTEAPSHMGNPPTPGFHGGTRGSTGESAAQRALKHGTDQMIDEVVRAATALAGPDGYIVVGGIPRVAGQLALTMERVAVGRVLHVHTLDVHATDADLAAAAQESASALRDAKDLRNVSDIIASGEAAGAASLGAEATRYALEQGAVREVYVTERYIREHTVAAEEAVRAALSQDAVVEEVSRGVASVLDERGGICARLRYALMKPGASLSLVSGDRGAPLAPSAERAEVTG